MDKSELIDKIETGWDELQAYIATLTPEQMTVPTDAAGWTVKDHLMHLAVWEDGVWALLEHKPRAEYMGLTRELFESDDYDAMNAIIRERQQALRLDEVPATFRSIHERLVGKIMTLTDEDLLRPQGAYQADSTWEHPVLNPIIGNTYHHYGEHIPWMQAIVQAEKGNSVSETPTMDKAELLEKMQAGWQELQAYIATLTAEQMSTPTDAAGWTVKDHLMHLAVWQDGVYALLEGGDRVAAMGVPQAVWDTREFDQINAVIQQNHRDKTAAEVVRTLEAVQSRFYAKIQALGEEALNRPNPGSPAGTRMIEYVKGDSYEHYAEHIPWMQAIVAG